MRKTLIAISITLVLFVVLLPISIAFAQGGTKWDAPMKIPSPKTSNSWFPDVAADSNGNVHVVWSETGDFGKGVNAGEALLYSVWNGIQWSQYTDIVSPQPDIIRSAVTISRDDKIHLSFDSNPPFSLYYKNANVDSAYSAARWTGQTKINGRAHTYMSDLVSWENYLHVVYDDGQFFEKECQGCADIFYRRSEDGGLSWTEPVALLNTKTGSARAQIETDGAGNLYVAWDEGWDRLTGLGSAEFGVFMYSRDQGKTWSIPLQINYPGNTNIQLTPAGNGQGGIMLVWRTISPDFPAIYYSWSSDWGQTWSLPQTLPNIASSQLENSFDIYDMAVDGNGHIHLVATGYLASNTIESANFSNPPGVFHFEWDGTRWTIPNLIFQSNWYPFYLKMSITNGNQINVVWHMKDQVFDQLENHQVWYVHGESSAEFIESPAFLESMSPVSVSIDSTPEILVTEATPTPMIISSTPMRGINPFSELDEYLILGIGIVPVLILILIVMRKKPR